MSDLGPVLLVSATGTSATGAALRKQFRLGIDETAWPQALEQATLHLPAAILACDIAEAPREFAALAGFVATLRPYVPMIAVGDNTGIAGEYVQRVAADPARIAARLQSALRVRADEAALMRRLAGDEAALSEFQSAQPADDAVVLLAGRGRDYPALSVRLGEKTGVIGCLSLEATAQQIRARDVDGIMIGGGFGPRHVDALLAAIAEDSRFRNLPVVVVSAKGEETHAAELPNLAFATLDEAVDTLMPLVAQQARLAHIRRAMAAIDAGGRLDPRTGLLTADAFAREFMRAMNDAQASGAALSAALFAFDTTDRRALTDAARIMARLTRSADFAAQEADGSIIAAFTGTHLTSAHVVARRLASALKHTLVSADGTRRIVPSLTLATMKSGDSAQSMLRRLMAEPERAAS